MPVAVPLAVLLSALALVISVISFFFFKSYLKRRTGQERILAEFREEVSSILRLIDETTDRDISLIEEKEKSLKTLLEEIDKRLKLYIRELDKRHEAEETHAALVSKTQSISYEELGKARRRISRQESPPASTTAAEPAPAYMPVAAASASAAVPAPGVASASAAAPEAAETAPLPVNEQIRELLRAGYAPRGIASRLGLSVAEVEFATALMERKDIQHK